MEPDEVAKEARMSLIAALKTLLLTYENDKWRASAEAASAESTLKVVRLKLRVLDASSAIARLRLAQLGARDSEPGSPQA